MIVLLPVAADGFGGTSWAALSFIAAGMAAGAAEGVGAIAVGVLAPGSGVLDSLGVVDVQPVVINTAATAATHTILTSFFNVFIRLLLVA
jgi:hypothetical protein